jgi:uncharacterized membrane protein HdeD (DUF308 family)
VFIVIGIWAILAGIIRIVVAIRARKENPMGLPLTLGILSLCFGLVILFLTAATFMVILWIIAIWAIIMGIVLLVQSVRARRA